MISTDIFLKRKDVEADQLMFTSLYRYLSWAFTSIFYLCLPSEYMIFKIGVIISLFICSRIINKAYLICENKINRIKIFACIEIIGIILLLWPTGGLDSPFIWYAMNPVLISASFSLYFFSWFTLSCYLSASIIISFLFFNPDNYTLNTVIYNNSYIILTFILITLAVYLLSVLNNRLRKRSDDLINAIEQLNHAKNMNQESLDYIKSLYQMIEALNVQENKINNVLVTFTEYLLKLTKSNLSFFVLESTSAELNQFAVSGSCPQEVKQALMQKAKEIYKNNIFNDKIIYFELEDKGFYAHNVKSRITNYGLIGVNISDSLSNLNINEIESNIEFISNLSAVILDRLHFDEVSHRLLLSEEQNRIANEMHDNIIQQLFGISCAIHTSLTNLDNMQNNEIKDQLLTIQSSAQSIMKELRLIIYNLSYQKGGNKNFQLSINNYLESISKLNNITVDFTLDGDVESIDLIKKGALYRIICEAAGNAVRHGKCSSIQINLIIKSENIRLKITDNGNGFDLNRINSREDIGLGLNNMRSLTRKLGGEINIESVIGKGTTITIKINNEYRENLSKGSFAV